MNSLPKITALGLFDVDLRLVPSVSYETWIAIRKNKIIYFFPIDCWNDFDLFGYSLPILLFRKVGKGKVRLKRIPRWPTQFASTSSSFSLSAILILSVSFFFPEIFRSAVHVNLVKGSISSCLFLLWLVLLLCRVSLCKSIWLQGGTSHSTLEFGKTRYEWVFQYYASIVFVQVHEILDWPYWPKYWSWWPIL